MDGGKPFALAGLSKSWKGPEGSEGPPVESCSLITTDANELAAEVHDRMPVILDAADYADWLDPANDDRDALQAMLVPYPADRMVARPVSTFVNNARNEGLECLNPTE